MEGLSIKLAEWATGLRFEDLPASTVKAAKARLLDTMAVTWAGSDADGIRPIRDMLVEQGGRGDASVLAYGDRLPAGAAAMLNGAMGAALDFDGLHEESGVHTDIVVLPAALALAEKQGASGKELLTAVSAGEEILIRLGLSTGTGPGWFFSSVFGVFGAAIAAGKVLALDAETINGALGVALCHAGGSQQNLVENRLTKRFQSGFAAQAGVTAAEMAAAGVGGPLQSLEGKFGLSTLFAPIDPAVLLDDLGSVFHMDQLTIKKYPSCFCNHAAIEAALQLTEAGDLDPAQIESIEVRVPPFSERLVGEPFDAATATQVTAQFNIAYSVACALIRRRFTLADIEIEAIRDSRVDGLAAKVRVVAEADNENRFAPVGLRIALQSGACVEKRVEVLPGTPDNPLDAEAQRAKAKQCFAMGARPLGEPEAQRLMDRIAVLETLSARDLLATLP